MAAVTRQLGWRSVGEVRGAKYAVAAQGIRSFWRRRNARNWRSSTSSENNEVSKQCLNPMAVRSLKGIVGKPVCSNQERSVAEVEPLHRVIEIGLASTKAGANDAKLHEYVNFELKSLRRFRRQARESLPILVGAGQRPPPVAASYRVTAHVLLKNRQRRGQVAIKSCRLKPYRQLSGFALLSLDDIYHKLGTMHPAQQIKNNSMVGNTLRSHHQTAKICRILIFLLMGYSVLSDEIYAPIRNFGRQKGTIGYEPVGGLIADPDGWLYGTTYNGGIEGGGTVYRVRSAIFC